MLLIKNKFISFGTLHLQVHALKVYLQISLMYKSFLAKNIEDNVEMKTNEVQLINNL